MNRLHDLFCWVFELDFKCDDKLCQFAILKKVTTVQFWLLAKQEEEDNREKGVGNRASKFCKDRMQLNQKS